MLFLKAENIYLRKLLADANVPAASSSEIQTEYDSQAHQQNGLNKRAKVEGKTSSSDDNNSEDNSSL